MLQDVPDQPSEQQLKENPCLCRFVLVFDREGYSPVFFKEMWRHHRIGCMTYHKHPGESWPEQWFSEHEVLMPGGEVVKMRLCEMGSVVGSGKDATWMRQVRKLTDSGHQTSVISTAFDLPHTQLAARMFSRWCQENFFNYMMQHFDIDVLLDYGVAEFPDTEKVVNPAWRRLMDTIRMIAYRAETAMVGLIIGPTVDSPDARSLLQTLFQTDGDVLPDIENQQLNIRLHGASRPAANRSLVQLFEHLNRARIKYPVTELEMVFELGGYTASNHAEGVR